VQQLSRLERPHTLMFDPRLTGRDAVLSGTGRRRRTLEGLSAREADCKEDAVPFSEVNADAALNCVRHSTFIFLIDECLAAE